jgi:Ca2+-binding EF-hand superfamily protein
LDYSKSVLKSVFGIGLTMGLLLTGASLAVAQSAPRPDPMLSNGPPVWDTNHDGIFTCEEWKSFMERLFATADRNHDGSLSPSEFETVKKADPTLAEADFGYFDENQDGKITRKEFVEKPSAFILRFDRNGDCRVTPDEIKAATAPKTNPQAPQERPRDRFH